MHCRCAFFLVVLWMFLFCLLYLYCVHAFHLFTFVKCKKSLYASSIRFFTSIFITWNKSNIKQKQCIVANNILFMTYDYKVGANRQSMLKIENYSRRPSPVVHYVVVLLPLRTCKD